MEKSCKYSDARYTSIRILHPVDRVAQQTNLYLSACKTADIDPVDLPKFEWDQIWQMRLGIECSKIGKLTQLYSRPEYNWRQMSQIRIALEYGLDATYLCNPELSSDQMIELRCMMQDGMDVECYAIPSIPVVTLKDIHQTYLSKRNHKGRPKVV